MTGAVRLVNMNKIYLYLIFQVLNTSMKVSRCLVLLELGFMSVEFILKQKRLNYLFNLIHEEDTSISKLVFLEQIKSPLMGDFVNYVLEDMRELDIKYSFEDISQLTKTNWKEIVKQAAQKACLKSLLKDKSKLSKGKEICYQKLEMQNYLKSGNTFNFQIRRNILRVRLRDVYLRGNFPNAFSNITCEVPECSEDETQKHVYHSYCIYKQTIQKKTTDSISYETIFGNNPYFQEVVARTIFENIEMRSKVIPSHMRSEGPGEPRKRGGTKDCSPRLVFRKARVQIVARDKNKIRGK